MAQLWGTDSIGGYLYADELSELLRMSVLPTCKYRQLADVEDFTNKGKKRGDTVHWNIFSQVATAGTTLTEGTAIPSTTVTIYQGTATLTEWGNSVDYSGKLDDLSKQDVESMIRSALSVDAKRAFDTAVEAQFDATRLRAVGGTAGTLTLTSNGTATATNNTDLSNLHVKEIVDTMKERDIPPYRGDDYGGIARPTTWRPLKDDLETIYQHTPEGFSRIMYGEIGRYAGAVLVEQTNVASAGWTNAASDEAYFFGADTVAEVLAEPEQIRGKIPGDYGRDKGVAWYALTGFTITHKADGTQGAVGDERIMKWDSAA